MGSKERIQHLKEHNRQAILEAALRIIKQEGWPAFNMRRIAEEIDYTAPIIYEYFISKESLILELTENGFRQLADVLTTAKNNHTEPSEQLEAMWLSYWQFAFTEKELYQTMFGVEMHCPKANGSGAETTVRSLFTSVMALLPHMEDISEEKIITAYYRCWSSIHGLISINLVNKGSSDEINRQLLTDAIHATLHAEQR